MKKEDFKNPKFLTTAVDDKGYPKTHLPEIAVAGRSNVGKSSLLNDLFNVRGLVKTSATPGKTQAINFFTLNDQAMFVDLPGYGYAAVPDSVRKNWGPMIQGYLQNRPQLKLILFLFDIRRVPNEDDLKFLDWAVHADKAVILVLTKTDKVTLNQRNQNTQKILKTFNASNLHYTYYSVLKSVGRQELMAMITDALRSEAKDA